MIGLKFLGTLLGVADSVVQAIPLPVMIAGLAVPPLTVLEPAAPFIKPVVHGITGLVQGKNLASVASNAASGLIPGGDLLKGTGGLSGLVSGTLGGKEGLGNLVKGAAGALTSSKQETNGKESEPKGKESKDSENAEENPGAVNTQPKNQMIQAGGSQTLTTEAQIMGTVIVALIAGGSLKGLVDYIMTE
jgi:hypothetical protein